MTNPSRVEITIMRDKTRSYFNSTAKSRLSVRLISNWPTVIVWSSRGLSRAQSYQKIFVVICAQ